MNSFIIKRLMLSLNRFFFRSIKSFPCMVAGRFYPVQHSKYKLVFHLKSQGLKITCRMLIPKEENNNSIRIKKSVKKMLCIPNKGDIVAVKVMRQMKDIYQIKSFEILFSVSCFKELDFSYSSKGKVIQEWNRFLVAVKDFFYTQGLVYAETPSLVSSSGVESYLYPFKTRVIGSKEYKFMYLITSPEIHLKKLLCQDWTDFFEIKKCYRNKEISSIHQAEFTMLEWYRAFYSSKDLMQETYKLLCFLQQKDFFKVPLPKAKIYTLKQLFKKYINFTLTNKTSKKDLRLLLRKHGVFFQLCDNFSDLFFLVFLNLIEPKLPKSIPVFVCGYPSGLRGFAKLNEQGFADRFELYWQGMELANAFYEVTDYKTQLALFKDELSRKKKNILCPPIDSELVKLMKDMGMPSCSGIALGLDRLFLAITGRRHLKQTRLFYIM